MHICNYRKNVPATISVKAEQNRAVSQGDTTAWLTVAPSAYHSRWYHCVNRPRPEPAITHSYCPLCSQSGHTHSSSSTTAAAARPTTCAQESVPASSLWPSTRWPSCPSSATSCCFSPGGKWSMLKTDTSPRRWNTWGGSSEGAWWWVDFSPACGRWAWPRGL